MPKILGGTTSTPLNISDLRDNLRYLDDEVYDISQKLKNVKVDVDDKMDLHSTNPVQNRVVYNEFIDVRSAMDDLDIKLDTEIDALKITATEARNTAHNAQTTADEAKELANGVLPRLDALEDGGGLPKASEEDNDKVLTVVNGEAQWALHAGLSNKQKVLFADDGEGNVSIVLVDADEDEDNNVIVDEKLDINSTNAVQNKAIVEEFQRVENRVDAASNTANEAKTTAINAGDTASMAASTASGAYTTANEAKTTANTALSTANEAKTAAQGASATANEAKTDASTASANANSAVITASGAYSLATEANSAASSAQQTLSGVLPRLKRLEAGGGVTVDDHIDPNSTNPLQNAVIAALIGNIRGALDGIIVLQEALIEGGKENVAAYFMRHVNDAADGIIALQEALIAGADDSVIIAVIGDINDAICSVAALQNALVYAGGEDVASNINEALDGIIALQDELIAI